MSTVLIASTKYDGSKHYRFDAAVLSITATELRSYTPPNVMMDTYRGQLRTVSHALRLFWTDRDWNMLLRWRPDGSLEDYYVNIATPAVWTHDTVSWTDLDLDVIWRPKDPEPFLDDADEFELHSRQWQYPVELVERCWGRGGRRDGADPPPGLAVRRQLGRLATQWRRVRRPERRGGRRGVKVGILSDTHGRVAIARRAIALLQAAGTTAFVHCGDVGGPAVVDALAGLTACFVFGNNDDDADDLIAYAEAVGVTCLGYGGLVEWGGKRLAVTHGDNAREVARLTKPDERADYLLTGHSHVPHDRRVGSVRWINPGALYRATPKTVAVLDLDTDTLQTIEVPDV